MSLLDIFKPNITYNITARQIDNISRSYIDGMTVADFYKKQPHLQTVVSFISQNIAQLPLKLYEKHDNGDRRRVYNNSLAQALSNPNDNQSTYDLILQTVSEYKLYGEAFWYVAYGKDRLVEVNCIPNRIIKGKERDGLHYGELVLATGAKIPFKQIIHFHNYDPFSAGGLSPVESLKHILLEQVDAWDFRRSIWKNRGFFNEYISRPKDVEPLTEANVHRFRENFSEAWNGRQAGKLPLLEDGMEIKSAQFNSRELQWLESAQLSLDTVSAVYHIRSSLVGGSTAQSYASAKDNARALYSDALAPDLKMLADKLNNKLIPMLGYDNSKYYFEFDIQAKLEGSLLEQAQSLKTLVDGSVMKLSEARERLNLNYVDGSDALLIPLNSTLSTYLEDVQVKKHADVKVKAQAEDTKPQDVVVEDEAEQEQYSETVTALAGAFLEFFNRQERSLSSAFGAGKADFNKDRWNKELTQAIEEYFYLFEEEYYPKAISNLPQDVDGKYDTALTLAFIASMAKLRAEMINEKTLDRINDGMTIKEVFADSEVRADEMARTAECAVHGFVDVETVSQNAGSLNENGYKAYKTWVTTSGKPRPSHASTEGERVPVDEPFSLGGMFPGDSRMPAEETVNCMCILDITYEKE